MLSQIRFAVIAQVSPACLSFNATPSEFIPGTNVTLCAQAVNPLDGAALGGVKVQFLQDGSSIISSLPYIQTGLDGVATLSWQYLDDYAVHTVKAEVVRDNSIGNFSLTLSLPSVNDQPTTYNVQASFQGDNPSNATAYGYTPNGTQYAVCTTVQYGYKPSCNCTVVIVEPTEAQVITATKTMEQKQQEAQGKQELSVWPEFSWWYPWFRIHIDAHVDPGLSFCLDLFGSGDLSLDGAQNKSDVDIVTAGYGAVTEASLITAVSVGIAMFPENIAALIVGGTSLFIGTMVALGAACAYSGGAFCSYAWGMLPVLSIALLMTFQYPHPLVWLKSVADLWAKFSQSPAISAIITSLTVCASLAMALIWPPPLRCMLSIPIVLCMISIWISMGF
jgi:hypothetical protein